MKLHLKKDIKGYPHQHEKVKKHLKEMMEIGAI